MPDLMKQGGKKTGVGLRPQPVPTIMHGETMNDVWEGLNDRILWARREDLAYWSSLDSMVADVVGMADKATFSLDIGADLWVTPSRWNTLTRQYVDPERLFSWLESVKDISTYKRGIVAMDMNPVQKTVVASNARANRRKHGGCMRMVTYRAFPQPTVTLYSRTSYLGYIGGLDMLLAYKLIEQACDMIGDGLSPEEFQFRWHIEVAQFHGFKSLAYLFSTGQDKFMRMSEKKWASLVGKKFKGHTIYPLEEMPTWQLIRYWWARIQKQDAEEKPYSLMRYGAEKRIRRRFHAQTGVDQTPYLNEAEDDRGWHKGEKEYKPLSTPIELITLDKMLYATPESRAKLRKQKFEKVKSLVEKLEENTDWLDLSSISVDI
jgi:hypothetical protein